MAGKLLETFLVEGRGFWMKIGNCYKNVTKSLQKSKSVLYSYL